MTAGATGAMDCLPATTSKPAGTSGWKATGWRLSAGSVTATGAGRQSMMLTAATAQSSTTTEICRVHKAGLSMATTTVTVLARMMVCLRGLMRKVAATFAPTAMRWQPSARSVMAAGATRHSTISTNAPAQSATTMDIWCARKMDPVDLVTATATATDMGEATVTATGLAGTMACPRAVMSKVAGTSAPKAMRWQPSVRSGMAAGAIPHSTILTNAPAQSPTTMDL